MKLNYVMLGLLALYSIALSVGILLDGARSDQRIAELEQQHEADTKKIAELVTLTHKAIDAGYDCSELNQKMMKAASDVVDEQKKAGR